jgi:hypothetical protein
MSRFSPSEAALEGFRLTRERPGTILGWAGVYFTGVMATAGLMMVSLGPAFIDIARKGRFDSEDIEAVSGMLAQSWPAFLLVLILVVTLMSVITAGIYRLILRPSERGFLHLRLGRDELRLTAVNLMLFGFGLICFTAGLVLTAAAQGVPLLGALLGLAFFALTLWVGVRLSLVTPLTFDRGRISIREGWEITRGRFWPLFGMIVMAVIFYVIVWLLMSIISFAIVGVAGGGQAVEGGSLNPVALIAGLATLVLQFVLSVLQLVMIYAPLGLAYQQFRSPTEEF